MLVRLPDWTCSELSMSLLLLLLLMAWTSLKINCMRSACHICCVIGWPLFSVILSWSICLSVFIRSFSLLQLLDDQLPSGTYGQTVGGCNIFSSAFCGCHWYISHDNLSPLWRYIANFSIWDLALSASKTSDLLSSITDHTLCCSVHAEVLGLSYELNCMCSWLGDSAVFLRTVARKLQNTQSCNLAYRSSLVNLAYICSLIRGWCPYIFRLSNLIVNKYKPVLKVHAPDTSFLRDADLQCSKCSVGESISIQGVSDQSSNNRVLYWAVCDCLMQLLVFPSKLVSRTPLPPWWYIALLVDFILCQY